jgi:aminoglycoside 3-N-acetyltransferase
MAGERLICQTNKDLRLGEIEMQDLVLFESNSGNVTSSSLRDALHRSQADDSDILYVHTGLSFGKPPSGLDRNVLLANVVEVLLGLGVKTICLPTFTFSFCNGESFDVNSSKSKMGVLNEYFRKRTDVTRSADPLMSVAVYGEDIDLVQNLGIQSTGKDSTFDKLDRKRNVRFLFLGVQPGDCFTYMHYLEWKAGVPYRYDRRFEGDVVDCGIKTNLAKLLYVRYKGVTANDASYTYGNILHDQGNLTRVRVGDSLISAVTLEAAKELYLNLLNEDLNYFISEPFDRSRVTDDFEAHNMVAL